MDSALFSFFFRFFQVGSEARRTPARRQSRAWGGGSSTPTANGSVRGCRPQQDGAERRDGLTRATGTMEASTTTRMLFLLLTLSTLMLQTSAEGVFELAIHSFHNRHGILDAGECCQGTPSAEGQCSSSCRTFFRICLKQFQANVSANDPCSFGVMETVVVGDNNFILDQKHVFINPIRFHFAFGWPGDFTLIIEAFHDKTPDETPRPGSPRVLIRRLAAKQRLHVGKEWMQQSFVEGTHEFKYSFRVLCNENYFGEKCTDFCRPRDDPFGHYDCSAIGKRICKQGWSGEYCTEPVCSPECDLQRGKCVAPNQCKCNAGWSGPLCNQCETRKGCVHGFCNQPWQCVCEEGWAGANCDLDLRVCERKQPCLHGATCTNVGQGQFKCRCPPAFTGQRCETLVDNCHGEKRCQNGGTCRQSGELYVCVCPLGFSGPMCEMAASPCDSSPCQNGGQCQTRVETHEEVLINQNPVATMSMQELVLVVCLGIGLPLVLMISAIILCRLQQRRRMGHKEQKENDRNEAVNNRVLFQKQISDSKLADTFCVYNELKELKELSAKAPTRTNTTRRRLNLFSVINN